MGFDGDDKHLAWGEMQGSGKLVFTANWNTDKLVLTQSSGQQHRAAVGWEQR